MKWRYLSHSYQKMLINNLVLREKRFLLRRNDRFLSGQRLIAILVVFLLLSPIAFANILSISSKIELSSNTKTIVTLHYQVDSIPASIVFRIIRFDEVEITNLTFSSENELLEHTFDQNDYPLLTGTLSQVNPGITSLITITYLVQSVDFADKAIPIVLLDLKPPQAANGVFTAEITYPDGYELQQSFPSIPWTESELQSSFDMQVIPSVIKATLIPSGNAVISPTTLIDIFVMISLIGLSYLGWRRLKSQST